MYSQSMFGAKIRKIFCCTLHRNVWVMILPDVFGASSNGSNDPITAASRCLMNIHKVKYNKASS